MPRLTRSYEDELTAALGHRLGRLAAMVVLGTVIWQRRWRRARLTRQTPLIFEDALPNEVEPLRLSAY
jgi:hypothetical protein